MNLEGEREEWFSSRPGRGLVYRLIEEATASRDRDARIRSIIALGETGDPRAVRALVDSCADQDPEVREHAVKALRKLRSCRAVPVLLERLGDRKELAGTRRHAAVALGEIGSYSAVEGLRGVLADSRQDPELRSFIANVLGKACARSRARRVKRREGKRGVPDMSGQYDAPSSRLNA